MSKPYGYWDPEDTETPTDPPEPKTYGRFDPAEARAAKLPEPKTTELTTET